MAYPDLPASPSFWRCPECGNETLFRASGTARIECGRCRQVWTADQLVEARAHADSPRELASPR
jgi:uncharacterized protein (DUF983 family)